MKAIRLHDRGGPEQLFFEDAPAPAEVDAAGVEVVPAPPRSQAQG